MFKVKQLLLALVFLLSLTACQFNGDTPPQNVDTPDDSLSVLSEGEQENVKVLLADTQSINDDNYIAVVNDMNKRIGEYDGKVYLIEGVFTKAHDGDVPYIYRTQISNDEELFCGLPLQYVYKDIPEGAWIRATGIINVHDINGTNVNALEVVAIQTLPQPGNATLS